MITGPVRGVLEGEGRYAGKVYFFQGDRYWRYDLRNKDYGEVDYPRPLSAWKLPAEFKAGIDACIRGRGKYKGKSYFFKDAWYARYDWKSEAVDARGPIAKWDKLESFPFISGVDAALNGQGRYEDKAYFFKGDKYARFDWKTEEVDLVNQKLSAWHLGDRFNSDITACATGDEGGLRSNATAYFFKGNEYVKYDWKEDRGLTGYPLLIPAGWPSGCAVWAVHSQFPAVDCPDPRLDAGRAWIAYPWGTLAGQAGWQVRVRFTAIKDLAANLYKLVIPEFYGDEQAGKGYVQAGRITRLGMCAHGMAGFFGANGPNGMSLNFPDEGVTDMKLLQKTELREDFQRIATMLAPKAPVLLLGCEAGQGIVGGQFVMTLSMILKDHPITAFTSLGYAGGEGSKRTGETCNEAGMRDTNALKRQDLDPAKYWGNLAAWPWASEFSPRAKTALNGEIIRRPDLDIPSLR